VVFNKKIKWGIYFIVLIVLIYLYKTFNPADNIFFPKCPFRTLTGYKCPGCGSQRAIHSLLNLNITSAFKENLLLVISIPYLLIGFVFNTKKVKNDKIVLWRKLLYGTNAIKIILVLIILFWILRNISCCELSF